MPRVTANDMTIEYETFGDSTFPVILLIMGLSGQMTYWQDDFCKELSREGFHVIRYDNRDSGLSTRFSQPDRQKSQEMIGKIFMGEKPEIPYTIEDMADDALGLLDALDIRAAHICGMSMGGFIAQTFVIKNPSRAQSLISIYSHPGRGKEFLPESDILDLILTPAPDEKQPYIAHTMRYLKAIFGTGLPFDEHFHKDLVEKGYERSFCPEGSMHQYLAILAQKDRTEDLKQLNLPALIIHGDADPLVPVAGGRATADAIKNAEFKIINGMGHSLPNLDAYWSTILDLIVSHARKHSL